MFKRVTILFVFSLFSFHVSGQNWVYDLDQAKEIASAEDKTIIIVFQGSDWCGPCKKLEKEIWHSKEFIEYADSHYVMLKADFPRKKKNKLSEDQQKKNEALAEKYNLQGFFPLVVVMDKDANVLKKAAYKKMSPSEYIEYLNSY
jgi:thioredoxin-related protein